MSNQINKVVRAGAGAGKTTALVAQVLEFQQEFQRSQGRMSKVAVTTFTRKATEELRERLLAKALQSEDKNLINFVQRSSQLHISTIHGVLALLLQRHGSAMGLPPKLEFISGRQQILQIKKIFRGLIQSSATLAKSVNVLLESYDLPKILMALREYSEVSFKKTRPISADELRSKQQEKKKHVYFLIEDFIHEVNGDLPDSWPQFSNELKGIAKNLSTKSVATFLEVSKFPRKSKKVPESLSDKKEDLKAALEDFSEFYLTDDFISQHQELVVAFEAVAKEFSEKLWQEKISSGQISMGDLEPLSLQFIQQHPDLVRNFSQDWDYWLVDEFQDTSPVQIQILKSLVGKQNYYTVGDPQQSIYLFRGSRTEVFENRETEADEKILQMKNYRSSPDVLGFVNEIFSTLPSQQFQKMEIGYDIKKRPLLPVVGEAIQILFCNQEVDGGSEIEAAIFRMRELLQLGVPAEQICVLARTNKDLENLSLRAEALNLPVKLHASSQFSERQEIIDAGSLLRVLINPESNLHLLQCLRSPFHRVPETVIQEIARNSKSATLWATAIQMEIPQVLTIQRASQRGYEIGIVNAWIELLKESNYFEILHNMDSSGQKEANLWKLISVMKAVERHRGFNPLSVLEDYFQGSLESGDGEGDASPVIEPQKINLMTIHASKGLEFDHVIVPFMGKRLQRPRAKLLMISQEEQGEEPIWTLTIPNLQNGKMTSSSLADELIQVQAEREFLEIERLYYVAFTRAKEGLTLIFSKQEEGSFASRLWRTGLLSRPVEPQEIQSIGYTKVCLRQNDWKTQVTNVPEKSRLTSVRPAAVTAKTQAKTISVTSLSNLALRLERDLMPNREVTLGSPDFAVKRFEISQRGIHAHRIFENLKYLPISTQLPGVDFISSWEDGKILSLIQAGEVEWGFTVKENNFYIQGQIDLWGQSSDFPQGAVVDYKTGSENNLENAFSQLEIYAWVLRKMGKLPTQSCPELLVVYPFGRSVKTRTSLSLERGSEYVRNLIDLKC